MQLASCNTVFRCCRDFRPYNLATPIISINFQTAARSSICLQAKYYVRAQTYTYLIISTSNYPRIFSDPGTPPIIRQYLHTVSLITIIGLIVIKLIVSSYFCLFKR